MDEKKEPKPKKPSVLTSPRFQALLQGSVAVAAALATVAIYTKKPAGLGE